ncbi:MAG: xylulokinase [Anaerolineae bacterium]
MAYLLSIDIGTSSVKTLLLAADSGRTLATAGREYPIAQPRPGYAEQNPDDWWEAAVYTVRAALSEAGIDPAGVRGIGFSGQMHGTVCLDRAARPVRPAIIWADTRSSAQVDALRARADPEALAAHAPGPPAAGFMGPTLMWLTAHEPDAIAATHRVILPKDYVRLRLTGEVGTEVSDAASTWLLDIASGQWSDWLLDLSGLERRYLPPVAASADVVGALRPAAADALGLPAGIPVVAGCADQPAQALGYGLFDAGTALATIGTGGQVLYPLRAARVDPQMRFHVFNHALRDRWYALAAILAAGLSLRWLRDLLGLRDRPDAYAYLSEQAAQVPPGAEGVVFLPHLAGERTPHMDPAASGVFVGLRLRHGVGHLARAVMEGVTFAMAECLALALDLAGGAEAGVQVIASGGAAASPVWRQIQADIYNTPLLLAAGENHACVGAALLAGVGCGVYASIEEACALLPPSTVGVMPDPARAAFYAERRALYRALYARLKDDMHRLSAG